MRKWKKICGCSFTKPEHWPEIGDVVDNEKAIKLCREFDLDYLAQRIEENPELYREWKFDGCSFIPDRWLGPVLGCTWQEVTYYCCLPHDLAYAYGDLKSSEERKIVDELFRENLIDKAGISPSWARFFYCMVRLFGGPACWLTGSWGFAHVDCTLLMALRT